MTTTISSHLKAKLGQYMRAVKEGKEVIVTDRDQPVARLVPFKPHSVQAGIRIYKPRDPSAPALGDLQIRAINYEGLNTTELLREDRSRR